MLLTKLMKYHQDVRVYSSLQVESFH